MVGGNQLMALKSMYYVCVEFVYVEFMYIEFVYVEFMYVEFMYIEFMYATTHIDSLPCIYGQCLHLLAWPKTWVIRSYF